MDVTTKAVVLTANDYRENDKMVLLYSLECGKISVLAKGVRKSSAKLKFACDQFCFGEYELAQNGDRYTLKTCHQLESFPAIRDDLLCYYAACTMAECIMNNTEEGESNPQVFVLLLKAFEQLCNGVDPLLVTLKFLFDFLDAEGFRLDFSTCSVCGAQNVKTFLDAEHGGVTCDNCRSASSTLLPANVVSVCKMLGTMPYNKLRNLKFTREVLKEALGLCGKHIGHSFSPLKTLSEFLRLA